MDLVTFGEAMLRLSPPGFRRLEQTGRLDAHVGGAELNVAVAAARLGLSCGWVSKLPDNPLGRMVRNKAREHGVDTSGVLWEPGGRLGLYFFEFGAAPRPGAVLYDRAHSAFSRLTPGEIDWPSRLAGVRCFHVTGISFALGPGPAEAARRALAAARRAGAVVCLDLNYRALLWRPEEAAAALLPLMDRVDVLFANRGDAKTVLGISAADDRALARRLVERFGLRVAALTVRESAEVQRCRLGAVAADARQTLTAPAYEVDIVDQLGRGDAFAAGFIFGYLEGGDLKRALDYGTALAALAHGAPGDFCWSTRAEVERLLAGEGTAVRR